MTGIRTELYDQNGLTRLAVLEQAADVSWLDVLSRVGACSFSLPVNDPKRAQLSDYRIVRFTYNGMAFGHRLSPEQTWTHGDGRGRVIYSGPGLGDLLNDYVPYPEFPLSRLSEDTRGFGPYSLSGVWKTSDAGWVAPVAQDWSDDSTSRAGRPKAVKKLAPHVDWISIDGADVDVPDGAVMWARGGFNLDDPTDVMIVWTGDNYVDQWVDGRLIGEADDDIRGWRKLKRWRGRLPTGFHQLAARVENAETTTGSNPLAYLCIVMSLKADGTPDRVLRKTNDTWDVHEGDPEPGWARAQVLRKNHLEAQGRGVRGALALSVADWSMSLDVDGQAFDDRGTYEVPVGGQGGAELASTMAEEVIDWWVDAAAMKLQVYKRKGANRTSGAGTVRLYLPQGLKGYQTARKYARKTVVLGRRANGRMAEIIDTSGVAAAGRMETGAAMALAGSEGTFGHLARIMLRRSSVPMVSGIMSGSALIGPQPGIAYNPLGDSILVPAHTGSGAMKARCLGVAVAQRGDTVEAYPLFTLDGSV